MNLKEGRTEEKKKGKKIVVYIYTVSLNIHRTYLGTFFFRNNSEYLPGS